MHSHPNVWNEIKGNVQSGWGELSQFILEEKFPNDCQSRWKVYANLREDLVHRVKWTESVVDIMSDNVKFQFVLEDNNPRYKTSVSVSFACDCPWGLIVLLVTRLTIPSNRQPRYAIRDTSSWLLPSTIWSALVCARDYGVSNFVNLFPFTSSDKFHFDSNVRNLPYMNMWSTRINTMIKYHSRMYSLICDIVNGTLLQMNSLVNESSHLFGVVHYCHRNLLGIGISIFVLTIPHLEWYEDSQAS